MNSRWIMTVALAGCLAAGHALQAGEGQGKDNSQWLDGLKKRLDNIEKQGQEDGRLQKDAEQDAALAALIEKRKAAAEAMKTHLKEMIAAIEAGDEAKTKELAPREKELAGQMETVGKSMDYARKAAGLRRELEMQKKKTAEQGQGSDLAVIAEKATGELIALYDNLAANPPERGKWIDDATAQKIQALEGDRNKAALDMEYQGQKNKLAKQLADAGENAAVKDAGARMTDLLEKMHQARLAGLEAKAKEMALMQERGKLDAELQQALQKAKQEKKEQQGAEKGAAKAPEAKPADPVPAPAPAPANP